MGVGGYEGVQCPLRNNNASLSSPLGDCLPSLEKSHSIVSYKDWVSGSVVTLSYEECVSGSVVTLLYEDCVSGSVDTLVQVKLRNPLEGANPVHSCTKIYSIHSLSPLPPFFSYNF